MGGKNIFAKIIDGEIPTDKVYEDDRVIAIKDINPLAPVHLLIIPKKEIPTVDDLEQEDDNLVGHMVLVARDLARKFGVSEQGYRLQFNVREAGGQTVYHLHLHLLGGRNFSEAETA